jgi:hypothetical protein
MEGRAERPLCPWSLDIAKDALRVYRRSDDTLRIAHCTLLILLIWKWGSWVRVWDFAADVARIVESIPDTRIGRHVAGQLIRSGTSSAPQISMPNEH